jgi:hypothetical protein
VRPVYGVEISAVLLEEALELGVRREFLGDLEQGLVQFREPLGRDGGLGDPDERRVQLVRGEVFFFEFISWLLLNLRHVVHDLLEHGLGLGLVQDAAAYEFFGPDLAHRGVVADGLVHHRLRVGRFVALIVPKAAVADEVDHEVLVELLAVGVGHPRRCHASLGVVGVDVDYGDLEPLCQVARVGRRAGVLSLRGEPELVVGDNVDGAAGPVAGQPAQVQRLGRDPLAGERRIPVQQDGQ